jgi:hypothetical protein
MGLGISNGNRQQGRMLDDNTDVIARLDRAPSIPERPVVESRSHGALGIARSSRAATRIAQQLRG